VNWVKPLSQLSVGVAGIAIMWYLLEIEDMLIAFWWAVCLPLMFLYFVGLIGQGTYNSVVAIVPDFMADLRARVEHHRARLSQTSDEVVQ
jgi:hypothetical protein